MLCANENNCDFICLDTDPQWQLERSRLITGSIIATIMGKSPFQTRDDLLATWGQEPEFSEDARRRMWWGSFSERHNMDAFSAITGIPSEPHNGLYRSKASPWLGATLDGFVTCWSIGHIVEPPLGGLKATPYWHDFWSLWEEPEDTGLIEMKQTSRVGNWSKEVPEYYWTQAQCGMYVTGLTWCVVCAKIGADDMRFHIVFPDYSFYEEMVEETKKFAEEVGLCV